MANGDGDGKGMMTHSGARVSATEGIPTLEDIVLSLSRIPRFAGHTRRPWSVLKHSYVVEQMALIDGESSSVRLAALLHDAHESLTGDVPSPLKPWSLSELQYYLDERIYGAYFPEGAQAYKELYGGIVHRLDWRALLAEAVVIGPPGINTDNIGEIFGGEPRAQDCRIVGHIDRNVGNDGNRFLELYKELSANITRALVLL